MNFIKSVLLFFLISSLPVTAIYLIFEDFLRLSLLLAYGVSYFALFFFADKFLLFFLGAREIIDSDNHNFFRVLKSSAFNAFETMPKVYLYSGSQSKAFIFESGKKWSIAIERNLMSKMTSEEVNALVYFLIENKKAQKAWFQTKCMGMIGGILKINTWVISSLFKWIGSKKVVNSIIIISLMFLKPIIEIINLLNYSGKIYQCPAGLKSIYHQSLEEEKLSSFNYYLSFQLIENLNQGEIIRDYLESYPVFERCSFDGEFV